MGRYSSRREYAPDETMLVTLVVKDSDEQIVSQRSVPMTISEAEWLFRAAIGIAELREVRTCSKPATS